MRLSNGNIYLDYNATTPLDPRVIEAMEPYLSKWFGNPSSAHIQGRTTSLAVKKAREQLAALLNCEPGEIIFTSSGSESNNMVMKGRAILEAARGRHIIISAIEHPAVTEVANYLSRHGFRVSLLNVNGQGVVSPDALRDIITTKTILVSVMLANNETGAIQPIEELAQIAHESGAFFHTDAAQAVGKMPVDVQQLGCDALSIAGHKLYAPKGVGALYLKAGCKLEPLIHGAGHEFGFRAGTENVSQIVGLGAAAEIARQDMTTEVQRLAELRDELQTELKSRLPKLRINALGADRLPNTLSMSYPGLNALETMDAMPNLLVSAGAACHSTDGKGSGVLEAMEVPLEYQLGTLRLSLGRMSDSSQVRQAVDLIHHAINSMARD